MLTRDLRARLAHLGQRPLPVPRLDLHRADRVLENDHLEALPPRVQHRGPDAVVRGQAAHQEAVHATRAQPLGKPGSVEGGVRLQVRVRALAEDLDQVGAVQRRVELGARGPGLAVGRPGAAPGFERAVVGRVPVAARHGQGNPSGDCVHRGEDGIPSGHGERSAGAEVQLRIDDQKRAR